MDPRQRLAGGFARAHPDRTARRLQTLDPPSVAAFLQRLDVGDAARIVDRMEPAAAAACLATLQDDLRSGILGSISVGRCVLIMRWIDPDVRRRVIDELAADRAASVQRALRYPAGTAGFLAETRHPPAAADTTAAELARRGTDAAIPYTYVVDEAHRLLGVVHRRELENADPAVALSTIMRSPPVQVQAWTEARALAGHPAWRDFDALPVVDRGGAFIGIVRHRRLRAGAQHGPVTETSSRPLTTFLDVAELYWAGLADLITIVGGAADVPQSKGNRHAR